jgi:hypothetical protein
MDLLYRLSDRLIGLRAGGVSGPGPRPLAAQEVRGETLDGSLLQKEPAASLPAREELPVAPVAPMVEPCGSTGGAEPRANGGEERDTPVRGDGEGERAGEGRGEGVGEGGTPWGAKRRGKARLLEVLESPQPPEEEDDMFAVYWSTETQKNAVRRPRIDYTSGLSQ